MQFAQVYVFIGTVCCLLSLQGLVPDDRIISALLTMHKYPEDYGWYMQVSRGLPVLPPFMCQPFVGFNAV